MYENARNEVLSSTSYIMYAKEALCLVQAFNTISLLTWSGKSFELSIFHRSTNVDGKIVSSQSTIITLRLLCCSSWCIMFQFLKVIPLENDSKLPLSKLADKRKVYHETVRVRVWVDLARVKENLLLLIVHTIINLNFRMGSIIKKSQQKTKFLSIQESTGLKTVYE